MLLQLIKANLVLCLLISTHQPLYNTVNKNTVLDITQSKMDPKNVHIEQELPADSIARLELG